MNHTDPASAVSKGDKGDKRKGEYHPKPEVLAAYHDGILTRRQQRGIKRHLSRCLRCAEEMAILRTAQASCAPAPPVELVESVHRWLAQETERGTEGT